MLAFYNSERFPKDVKATKILNVLNCHGKICVLYDDFQHVYQVPAHHMSNCNWYQMQKRVFLSLMFLERLLYFWTIHFTARFHLIAAQNIILYMPN